MQIKECISESQLRKKLIDVVDKIRIKLQPIYVNPIVLMHTNRDYFELDPILYTEVVNRKKFLRIFPYSSIDKIVILRTSFNDRLLSVKIYDKAILSLVRDEIYKFSRETENDIKEIRIISDFQ